MSFRRLSFMVLATALYLSGATARSEAEKDSSLKSSPKVLAAFRDVVARPSQSIVRLQSDGKDAALGTIVGPDGWIVSKASELKGTIVCKLRDGRELEARLVGVHELHDLALLKIDARGLTAIEWSDSKSAPAGNWVASAGPGDEPVAIGVISVPTRSVSTTGVARVPAAGSGYLGIAMEPAAGKVKITQVLPGSGADKAGLKANDFVLAVAGKEVEDPESLMNLVSSHKPGDVIALKIKRGDEELEVKATLGKRPRNRGDVQNNLGSELSSRRGGFPTILQHDTVLRPRDCGGPLVDLDGKVLGINIARAGRTESYAVPAEAVVPLLLDLMSGKLAPPPAKEKKLTAAEKLAAAKAALQKAEADRDAAAKKVAEARETLKKAEMEEEKEQE